MSLTQILGLLLALSVAGNALLARSYLVVRDERVAAVGDRDQARELASMCSDATEALHEAAGKRKKQAAAAIAAAAASGEARGRKAAEILAAGPSVPGDDCASAGDRFDRWLATRSAP